MAISADVLNTTYRRLKGPLLETFMRRTPFLDALYNNGKVREEINGGTTIERAIMTGSPSTVRGIFNGLELLSLTRAQRTEQLKVEPHRMAGAIAIPGKDLAENNGDAGVMKLIEKYPEAFMNSLNLCLESYLLTGTIPAGNHTVRSVAELYGFCTLFGGFTSGVKTGTDNGILQFAAPADQTVDIHNVASNNANKWINQYSAISSWNSEGLKMINQLIRLVNHYGMGSRASLGFVDPDTMSNFEETKQSHVRISVVDDKLSKDDTSTLVHKGVTFHESLDMDRALVASTSPAADGSGYILMPEFWEIPIIQKAELSDFQDNLADQDGVTAKFLFHAAGPICTHRATQACFTGSAL